MSAHRQTGIKHALSQLLAYALREGSRIRHRTQFRPALLLSLALFTGLLSVGTTARADETVSFTGETMTVTGGGPLARFDISFVDPRLGIYILADRSNAQVDVFSVVGRKFLFGVPGFAGFHGSNDTAGLNG